MFLEIIRSKDDFFDSCSPLLNDTTDLTLEEISSSTIQNFISALLDKVKGSNCLGLAANQVGKNYSIFVYKDLKTLKVYEVINPKVISRRGKFLSQFEGCESLIGYRCHVRRSKQISIKFLDRKCKECTLSIKYNKFLASIIQHECDHLKGIFMTDRAVKTFKD